MADAWRVHVYIKLALSRIQGAVGTRALIDIKELSFLCLYKIDTDATCRCYCACFSAQSKA